MATTGISVEDKKVDPMTGDDLNQYGTDSIASDDAYQDVKRPPIVYTSLGAFASSFGQRFRSIWTRRFALSFLAGQIVSLCITCTNVTTTELVTRNWALPTTQTLFLYVQFTLRATLAAWKLI